MGLGGGFRAFIRRYLSPADRLAETLCGLIMVLTFTLVAASQLGGGRAGVRELLLATIGCNFAWGIIDGALYILCAMAQRGRRTGLAEVVRRAPGEDAAVDLIRGEFDPALGEVAPRADRERLYRAAFAVLSRAEIRPTRPRREDLLGGLAILCVEISCTIPAALPFALLRDPVTALRVSNGLLLLLLFGVGYRWAEEIRAPKLATGLLMLLLGAGLVGAALLLGG